MKQKRKILQFTAHNRGSYCFAKLLWHSHECVWEITTDLKAKVLDNIPVIHCGVLLYCKKKKIVRSIQHYDLVSSPRLPRSSDVGRFPPLPRLLMRALTQGPPSKGVFTTSRLDFPKPNTIPQLCRSIYGFYRRQRAVCSHGVGSQQFYLLWISK